MASPRLLTTPEHGVKDHPILIIDKGGVIGYALAHSLKLSFLPLLVTQKKNEQEVGMIHIPYGKTFPRLPNNTFSHLIIMYQGEKEIAKLLPKLLRKAAKSGAMVSFITDYHHYSDELAKKLHGLPFVRTFVYGDLFGTGDSHSKVQSLIQEAKEKKKVNLSDMGLKTRYPIHYSDLVALVISTLFSSSQTVPLYFLAAEGRTELSLLRLLQNIDPLIGMDFVQSRHKESRSSMPKAALQLLPTSDLSERLREAMGDPLIVSPASSPSRQPQVNQKKKSSLSVKIFLSILLLFFLPILVELGSLAIGYSSLSLATLLLQKGETRASNLIAEASLLTFTVAEPSEELLSSIASFTSLSYPQSGYTVANGKNAAELLVSVSSVFQQLNTSLLSDHPSLSESTKLSLQRALILLQNLQAQGTLPSSLKTVLAGDQQSLSLITSLTDVLPVLLGYSGSKTYAVLFQDNTELRPGGGFIRSFMTFSISKGKVVNTKTYDVYDTDSNLPGYIEPPFLLQRYLNTAHLLLRDANMSENSSENASVAASLISLETKQKLSGVIAVDLSFFRGMLGITGPISLKKYNTTVTKETLFQQYEKSTNTLSGQAASSSFLAELITAGAASLRQKNTSAVVLSRLLHEATIQKHLLFYSSDPSIEKIISQHHLTSSPATPPRQDLFGIIESNLSANKTNYFLERKVSHTISLQDDLSASESVKIQYNNASNHDPLGGDYTAYLQLSLPLTASLQGVAINNTPQILIPAVTDPAEFTSPLFKEPSGLEVSVQKKNSYQLVGFPLKVKEGEQREVVIQYGVPGVITKNRVTSYTLSYFKQPGLDSLLYSLTLSYPPSLQLVTSPSSAENKSGSIKMQKTLTEDSTFVFSFKQ